MSATWLSPVVDNQVALFQEGESMAKQRKKSVRGGGSVFQRQDGRWEAKFKVEETGKYKSLYDATEKGAYRKLEEAKFRTLATGKDQTVKQFLEYWLEDVQKPTVRPNTYTSNHSIVHKHLVPGIGHIKLQKLTAAQLQSFYAKKLKEGSSASHVSMFNAVLHKALAHAKRIKLVGMNVSEDVDLPAAPSREIQPLTPEQARTLLEGVKGHALEALLTLAVTTGMRRGEILGLRWSDIDFEKGVLHVQRTLSYIAHYGFVEGQPKTPKSRRDILLPPFVLGVLEHHRTIQVEQRSSIGSLWVDRNLVFCDKSGGFIVPQTLLDQFSKALKNSGLPHTRFHDLRHSAATLLLSMGVPDKVVQELLGHTTNAQTNKYTHVLPSMQKDAMEKMNDFFQ